MEPKLWWTRNEVAERYGLAYATVAGWAVTGTGPKFVKFGGRVRYHVSDLEAFEQQLRGQAEMAVTA